MLMAMQLDEPVDDFRSIGDDFSTSNDESDLPKNLNMRFDACEDDVEMPESDGDGASVKLPTCLTAVLSIFGCFLCLMSDVRTMRMTTANDVPVPIAMSSKSPCDSPSIETFGTETSGKINRE